MPIIGPITATGASIAQFAARNRGTAPVLAGAYQSIAYQKAFAVLGDTAERDLRIIEAIET